MNAIKKTRIRFAIVIFLALLSGLTAYPQAVSKVPSVFNFFDKLKYNLGLDLQGGIHLEYKADMKDIESGKEDEALQAAHDAIERRVNAFGVGEPLIQTAKSGDEYRVIVELPGVKDIDEAKKKIKETPLLEFKEEASPEDLKQYDSLFESFNRESKTKSEEILKRALAEEDFAALAKEFSEDSDSKEKGGDLGFVKKGTFGPEFDKVVFESDLKDGEIYYQPMESQFGWHIIKKIESKGEGDNREIRSAHILFAKRSAASVPDLKYKSTGLTGKNLKNSQVGFANQGLSEPQIDIEFDDEGTKLFAEITKRNVGKPLAIYLDGVMISAPTVQDEITGGKAQITGNFTLEEAKEEVRRLNEGSLPIPLELVAQQSVEATLGAQSLNETLYAGIIGMGVVILFMIAYYRFLGLIASVALVVYAALMVTIFKVSTMTPWAITLTLSGIAGFILSVGMAVDANVLIFERTKEEIRNGRTILGAIDEGFKRAWPSVRDGNYTTILTSIILVLFSSGFIQGFAIVLIVGVLLSMFTAIFMVRTALKFFAGEWLEKRKWLINRTNQ